MTPPIKDLPEPADHTEPGGAAWRGTRIPANVRNWVCAWTQRSWRRSSGHASWMHGTR